MKNRFSFIAPLLMLTLLNAVTRADTLDFEELTLGNDSYFDGYSGDATGNPWVSKNVTFNTGAYTGGWSYSNVEDTTTEGFMNQWAAYAAPNAGSPNTYALANSFAPDSAWFNLPTDMAVGSVNVTNSTYAALSMLNGDGFGSEFGGPSGDDPDYFKVVLTGYAWSGKNGAVLGQTEFYLADYRFSDNSLDYIVDDWTHWDLSNLGFSRSIGVSIEGSDVGMFGLNTPAYFAIDDLQLVSIPEPGIAWSTAMLTLSFLSRKRRAM